MTPDLTAGWPSRETGTDPILGKPGGAQLLDAAHHDGQSTVGPGGNRIQRGVVLPTFGPALGPATPAAPLGEGFASSMEGGDGGDSEE